MSKGFYGWLDADAARPAADLHARLGRNARPTALLDTAAAGLAATRLPAGSSSVEPHIAVALAGHPRWSDTELARLAAERGHAAALRSAYERRGARCLESLQGSFALAVLEPAKRRLLLAIDRMGIEGLCYATLERGIVFGPDVRTIAAHPDVDGSLCPQALYDYLYFHVVPSPGTILRGVRKLAPAELLEFTDGEVRIERYWRPVFATRARTSERELAGELRSRLEQSVQQHAQPRAGAFLSGGIDSSTGAGLLARARAEQVDTFTIGFAAEGYDEMSYARIASRHFGTRAHEHYLTPDEVAAAVPRVAAHYDEPFGNSSAVPAYYCARLAHEQGTTMLLAGDGGDELFGGNSRYAKQLTFEAYFRLPRWLRSGLIEPALLRGDGDAPLLIRKARSYVRQACVPLPDRLQTYNYFSRFAAAEILHPELLGAVDLEAPLEQLRTSYVAAGTDDPIDRMLFLDWKFTLADNDLRKVSRMCELAGIDVAYPWLDARVVDLSLQLPGNWKVRGSELRWFARRALRGFLPAEILDKPKHGFGLPFGVWMREHRRLRELAGDSLASLRRRALVRDDYLVELQRRHRDEHAPYFGEFIWVLMMLEQWLQQREARGAQRPVELQAAPRRQVG